MELQIIPAAVALLVVVSAILAFAWVLYGVCLAVYHLIWLPIDNAIFLWRNPQYRD